MTNDQKFTKYMQVRKHATVYEFALNKDSLGELVNLLKRFDNISNCAYAIPGLGVKKMLQEQFSKLPILIQYMIEIWGIKELTLRCEHAIKVDNFRPQNVPILDIVASPDLYCIGGNFSSFDSKLTKKQMQDKTVNQVKAYMNANTPTCQATAAQVANAMLRNLDKNAGARKALLQDNNPLAYSLYFQKIADDMMRELGLPGVVPWVSFVNSWDILPNAPKNLLGISGGGQEPYIIINLKNQKQRAQLGHDDILGRLFTFVGVCETFAHEFVHFIDRQHPNRGALGAQKAILSDKIYDSRAAEHDNNPNEKTPLLTGTAVKQQLITEMFGPRGR